MQELKRGSQGKEVERWQSFLHGAGYKFVQIDGVFGVTTLRATKEFQAKNNLKSDGIVGQKTYAMAMNQGLPVVASSAFPQKPKFGSPTADERARMLGKFGYQILAGGQIKILDGWASKNITKIQIPQLIGIEGAPADGRIYFHRRGADQLLSLFAAWEEAGLLKFIKTWAGSFVPRMIRGSRTTLSNHAYGSAFDINAAWNGLGRQPATGEGTVIPLVKLANEHGFFWGGHYNSRKDGMHFELAVLNMFPKSLANLRDDEINFDIPDSAIGQINTSSGNPSNTLTGTTQAQAIPANTSFAQSPVPAPAVLQTNVDSAGNSSVQTTQQVADSSSAEKFKAYIPQINTAKKYFKRLTALTGTSAIAAFFAGLPEWLVIALFVLLVVIVIGGVVMFIKYHDKIFAYVTAMNTLRATEGAHNPILTTEQK